MQIPKMSFKEAKDRLWKRGWTHSPTDECQYRFTFLNRRERAVSFIDEQAVVNYVEDLIGDQQTPLPRGTVIRLMPDPAPAAPGKNKQLVAVRSPLPTKMDEAGFVPEDQPLPLVEAVQSFAPATPETARVIE